MKCPRCGERTRVLNSRTACTDTSKWNWNRSLRGVVAAAVSWYTQDWVARQRICQSCDWEAVTVEICIDDLYEGWRRRFSD